MTEATAKAATTVFVVGRGTVTILLPPSYRGTTEDIEDFFGEQGYAVEFRVKEGRTNGR